MAARRIGRGPQGIRRIRFSQRMGHGLRPGGSKGLCGKYLMPVMRKQQYRFQATNPNPQTKGRYACAPIGASTTFMSAGQVYPAIGEDMGYLVWRKRNCCAL